jgi:RimJ/RimL family protein N-acetyltransferase
MLVGEAVRLAGEAGAGKLRLGTRPWNAAMRAVCVSLGFVEEGTLRREYLGEDLVRYAYFYG